MGFGKITKHKCVLPWKGLQMARRKIKHPTDFRDRFSILLILTCHDFGPSSF